MSVVTAGLPRSEADAQSLAAPAATAVTPPTATAATAAPAALWWQPEAPETT